MKLTPSKRAARLRAQQHGLDMNLVALIDIFTILIFFLMSSTGIEVLTNSPRRQAACFCGRAGAAPDHHRLRQRDRHRGGRPQGNATY